MHHRTPRRRRGFSFIEVLFAVILLGIGFIMIAGVFSVGLQQTSATAQDTTATLATRGAVRMVQSIATNALFPPTGGLVAPFMSSPTVTTTQQLNAIGESAYFSADHRFAWLGFYRRNQGDSFMQVTIIALENANFPKYTMSTSASPTPTPVYLPPPVPPTALGTSPIAPTDPRMTTANLTYDPLSGNSYADITYNGATGANAVSGAYVLIANDTNIPSLTGRVVRLGNDLSSPSALNHFQLEPGLDLKDATENRGGMPVYIIGRAPLFNSTSNTYDGLFSGTNQDIGYVSTFVAIQPDVQTAFVPPPIVQ